jgi:AraC-like DNA-binding protein
MASSMLTARATFERDGVGIWDVACRHRAGRGTAGEHAGGHAVVFVRRGCFVRSADGVESLLDPTVAYCMNPGEEQRFDHPHGDGDECTSIALTADLAAALLGGEPELPAGPLPVAPQLDLEHRLVLSAARRGEDVSERALNLAARALAAVEPRRVASGRPATARARRALVDGAREALAEQPERSLAELARLLAVSPHHLSRIFRRATGEPISRLRDRVRVRMALERLAGGEPNLARLAAELGFADHPHLARTIRRETGHTTPRSVCGASSGPAPASGTCARSLPAAAATRSCSTG